MTSITTKTLLIAAALLAPAAGALAADDGFAGYNRGILGVSGSSAQASTGGPAMACSYDPFDGYRRGFNSSGPAQTCGETASGAQGPSGPTMASAWTDPFEGYKRGIIGAR